MQLRDYQQAAVAAVYEHLRHEESNPCVVIPTGGGKTPVIATICRDAVERWQGRVLVLAHVRELLQQTHQKLQAICPHIPVGIYSAGLNRRDRQQPVILASIQSIYKHVLKFDPFDLIIVDEAHLIPPEGDGMYRQLIQEAKAANPDSRVIGLTATPYRLRTGWICTPENILNHICFEISVRELIDRGYLSPLISKPSITPIDTSKLHIEKGEYVAEEVEALMTEEGRVQRACEEIAEHTAQRKAVLLFACSLRHGEMIAATLNNKGLYCEFISHTTPPKERQAILDAFRAGKIRYLCNVQLLTTGFDAPQIDAIMLLRPTLSPGLYYQMVGRGFRLHPSKENCLVLDFGGNIERHGPVDRIAPRTLSSGSRQKPLVKKCPSCTAMVPIASKECPYCQTAFSDLREIQHDLQAAAAPILSTEPTAVQEEIYEVREVRYSIHRKRGAGPEAPRSLRVDYRIHWKKWISEWICVEHQGYARLKAENWWLDRSSLPIPNSAEEAYRIACSGALAAARKITVRYDAKDPFPRITSYELDPIPEMPQSSTSSEDIPW